MDCRTRVPEPGVARIDHARRWVAGAAVAGIRTDSGAPAALLVGSGTNDLMTRRMASATTATMTSLG
jgi:hypothetical protein